MTKVSINYSRNPLVGTYSIKVQELATYTILESYKGLSKSEFTELFENIKAKYPEKDVFEMYY